MWGISAQFNYILYKLQLFKQNCTLKFLLNEFFIKILYIYFWCPFIIFKGQIFKNSKKSTLKIYLENQNFEKYHNIHT